MCGPSIRCGLASAHRRGARARVTIFFGKRTDPVISRRLQKGKTLFLETWVSMEDQPLLSTVLPAVQDVAETVSLKATGKTLAQLDNSHISPFLAHVDVEYLDGAARKTVDLWSVVLQKLAADMLMKHIKEFDLSELLKTKSG